MPAGFDRRDIITKKRRMCVCRFGRPPRRRRCKAALKGNRNFGNNKKQAPLPLRHGRCLRCAFFAACGSFFRTRWRSHWFRVRAAKQVREVLNKAAGLVALGPFSLHTVRKLAHFTEFALVGFWFMLCLRVYTRHFVKHVSWPLFVGLLVAVLDETVQLYVPGAVFQREGCAD